MHAILSNKNDSDKKTSAEVSLAAERNCGTGKGMTSLF